MLSPTPVILFCVLLLYVPVAIVFTVTSTFMTTTIDANENSKTLIVHELHSAKDHQKIGVESTVAPLLPPRPPDDDELLFHMASKVDPKPSPATSPKKLAFMFLTTVPLPFAPLWELYFNQTSKNLFNIYINADPSRRYNPPFSGVFAQRRIPSTPACRFTPALALAARRLLARALLHDPSNAMFALLSPSCIPLHSFNFTYKTLIGSNKSFIEILNNERWAYGRWAARGDDAMLPEVKLEDHRIGSQFWVLTRKHARLVVRDRSIWSKFKLPCVRWYTCYPEENYFPTLLSMQDPQGCVPATLTHVDWKGQHDGHPRTYKASEVGRELILSLRKDRPRYGDDGINGSDSSVTQQHDPFLFARKFSFDSIQPLMRIANDVIFKD
ncbi:hypothetical protein CJ030_MR8G012701 [Morella rubra]|uniref:Glycosyltransferase BC10 n=1 Tax=Morella rubra TaxID=262757 RepID=A0A6A1UW45_9ROSI|nr:hypothetical protein CJ030_MR8G012701 [Morella rubra]